MPNLGQCQTDPGNSADQSNAEAVLQLRADSLSDSQPLQSIWLRWRANITGANQNRKTTQ